MPVKFTPDLIPRFDQTFLGYINTNMQRLKQSLEKVAVETISTTAPASPYTGQRYINTTLGIDYVYNGTSWIPVSHWGPYIAYTPVLGGTGGTPALGNGTISGAYKREGSEWHVVGILNIGSTTVLGTTTNTVTLPSGLTSFNTTNLYQEGTGFLNDTGTLTYLGHPYVNANSTSLLLGSKVTDATHEKLGLVTSTSPFTWVNTDWLTWSIHIRGA